MKGLHTVTKETEFPKICKKTVTQMPCLTIQKPWINENRILLFHSFEKQIILISSLMVWFVTPR